MAQTIWIAPALICDRPYGDSYGVRPVTDPRVTRDGDPGGPQRYLGLNICRLGRGRLTKLGTASVVRIVSGKPGRVGIQTQVAHTVGEGGDDRANGTPALFAARHQ